MPCQGSQNETEIEPRSAGDAVSARLISDVRHCPQEAIMKFKSWSFAISVVALFTASAASAQVMCPDGSFISRGPCVMCHDGSFVAGSRCVIAPNASSLVNKMSALARRR